MIDINELRDGVSKFGGGYLTDSGWSDLIDRLEAAEKDVAIKEEVIDSLAAVVKRLDAQCDAAVIFGSLAATMLVLELQARRKETF